jgi:hypothetical protein
VAEEGSESTSSAEDELVGGSMKESLLLEDMVAEVRRSCDGEGTAVTKTTAGASVTPECCL